MPVTRSQWRPKTAFDRPLPADRAKNAGTGDDFGIDPAHRGRFWRVAAVGLPTYNCVRSAISVSADTGMRCHVGMIPRLCSDLVTKPLGAHGVVLSDGPNGPLEKDLVQIDFAQPHKKPPAWAFGARCAMSDRLVG